MIGFGCSGDYTELLFYRLAGAARMRCNVDVGFVILSTDVTDETGTHFSNRSEGLLSSVLVLALPSGRLVIVIVHACVSYFPKLPDVGR